MPNWNAGKGGPYAPGPTPNYAPQYAPPPGPPTDGYGGDQKSPYEGDRFRPRKRVNDPLFLIFFVAQVRVPSVDLGAWTETLTPV